MNRFAPAALLVLLVVMAAAAAPAAGPAAIDVAPGNCGGCAVQGGMPGAIGLLGAVLGLARRRR